MSAHTPGPWMINTVVRTAIDSGAKHIAMVNYSNSVDEDTRVVGEEHEANVRLIAAAPELLGALKDVVERLDVAQSYLDGGRIRTGILSAMFRASNLIAKVEGDQK